MALRRWIIAARPWALPASTMPVIFGTSLAVVIGGFPFRPVNFILSFVAMIILHSAANMLSDVFDFRRGLDREITPVSGAIVRGWLTPRQVGRASAVLFALGSLLGVLLVLRSSVVLLYVGLVGVAIGASYTLLKYHALGDLAVFLNFGLLGSLGSWVTQTSTFSLWPVIWAAPQAMLVIAILHANNWRDTISDKERKVTTMASLLGDRGSLVYYGMLVYGSLTLVIAFAVLPRILRGAWPALPLTFLLVILALPKALALWQRAMRRRSPRKPMDFIILDGATANYNLVFGLLCIAALWLDFMIHRL